MTNTPKRLRPRKDPVQRRAHETRERILDAAARVFARHGYPAGTTNRIAAEAGLSIGSVYQYFPNKDSMLVELMRRHVDEGVAAVAQHVAAAGGLPERLEDRLALVVDAALASHVGDPRLHQVLFEEAPRPRIVLDELHAAEMRLVGMVESLLRSDPGVEVTDAPTAARIAVWTVESLVHRFVSSATADVDAAAFRHELVTMLTRYLRPSSA